MASRSYESPELFIDWEPERCIHVAACLAAAPGVFDPKRRPWVEPENGSTEEIIAAIEACPTGALRYRRKDGVAEDPGSEATIYPVQSGPLVVRGPLEVTADDGSVFATGPRMAFCRCGRSGNQPFCDNSHRTTTIESEAPVPRSSSESPDEICPPQDETFG